MPDQRPIAELVWETKYRRRDSAGALESSIDESMGRVAAALAAPESAATWEERFFRLLQARLFLPGGRILAGAGTRAEVTLFNCFVLPPLRDESFDRAKEEAAETMRRGGGIGFDLSLLAPRDSRRGDGGAPGVAARLAEMDAMCEALLAGSSRRGAMMATLRCDHPDISDFIQAKRQAGALRNFNLSVQVTDGFMAAVRRGDAWPLVDPDDHSHIHSLSVARDLWDRLLHSAYESAEPGLLFVDRINALNNLYYCEHITATNPCGEVPLPPYDACDLGSLNLPCFVRDAFTPRASVDREALGEAARLAVRMLDNVIEISRFPLPDQKKVARSNRRIGLGITGLADMLVMLGLRYDGVEARGLAAELMSLICTSAYRASIALAAEKGAFPAFDRDRYLQGRFIAALPADLREGIARRGIRNSHLLAIAPTGSISLLAGAVSSGLEPIFAPSYSRMLIGADGIARRIEVTDHAVAAWREHSGSDGLPPAFVAASGVAPQDQLAMQAVLQAHVDNAISKTVSVAGDLPFEDFARIYETAFDLGLKGCTVFRPGTLRGSVIEPSAASCRDAQRPR